MTPRPEWLPREGTLLLGRFELTSWMGVGIHGGLFKAADRIFKKEVALKVFRPELFRDAARETNLFRLYRTRAYMHKHLLGVKDIFVTSDYVFLTEPYFACQNLREVLLERRASGKPFTKRELADLFSVLCNVLQWVHRIGVHGNVKPENILFAGSDLRISDPYFLAGKANIPDPPAVTPAWDHYVAPEQAASDLEEIRQSDIYALGLVIGEMLLGTPVRPGVALSEQGPFFSNDLDAFFLKATASDSRGRFGDVTSFWTELRRIFQIEPAEWETSDVAGLIDLEEVDEDVVHAEELGAGDEVAAEAAPIPPAPVALTLEERKVEERPADFSATALATAEVPPPAHAIANIEDEEPGFDESDEALTVIASGEALPAETHAAPEASDKVDLSAEEPGFDTADVDFTVAELEAMTPPPAEPEPVVVEEIVELDETDTTSHFEEVALAEPSAPASELHGVGETVEIAGIPPIVPAPPAPPKAPEPDRRGETVEIGVPPLPPEAAESLPPPLPAPKPAPAETRLMAAVPPPPDDVIEDLEPYDEEDLPVAALDEGEAPEPPATFDDDHLPVPSARLDHGDDVVEIGHDVPTARPTASQASARPLTKAERKAQKKGERKTQPGAPAQGQRGAPLPPASPAPAAPAPAAPAPAQRGATAPLTARPASTAGKSAAKPAPHRPVAHVEAERSSNWSIAVAILGVVVLGAVIWGILGTKKEPTSAAQPRTAVAAAPKAKKPAAPPARPAPAKPNPAPAPAPVPEPAAAAPVVAPAPAAVPAPTPVVAPAPVAAPAPVVAPAPAPAPVAPVAPAPASAEATAGKPVAPAPAPAPAPVVAPAPAPVVAPAPAPIAKPAPAPTPVAKVEPPKPAPVPAPVAKVEPPKPAPTPAPVAKVEPPKPEPVQVAVVQPSAPVAPAAPTTCNGNAQKLTRTAGGKKVSYCIDRYEFPGKGSTPKTGVTWDAAQGACKAQGKRLCTAAEWTTGCGGKYPYGATYDPAKCNTAGEDDEERPLVPTGSKATCKSPAGLYDMSGNVAEWVDEGTVHGGSSERDGDTATCGRSAKRFKGAGNAFVGFRCCADVQ